MSFKATKKPTSELRALTQLKKLPPNGGSFAVLNDGSEPHLRKGEYAIVDLSDRELQHGELYLVQWNSGTRGIKQARSAMLNVTGPGAADSLVWFVADLCGFRKTRETAEYCGQQVPIFAGLSDGPYETEDLKSKLLGRIVGYSVRSLGNLIKPERDGGFYRHTASA
jgi:hypothetical protein